MYKTLYRKWRPKTFGEVQGQDHITSVLRYEVETGTTSHAYLFCGSRGTGKTTCAKLLARAVNCEHPVNGSPCGECDVCRGIDSGNITDVIEVDAASNNGVDYIRQIRENVAFPPSECRKRVYIIDEVHMLSAGAFNALLKTLEEPPEYVMFILATTELRKVPATILSRCQRFDFHRIETGVIASRLRAIADAEGISIEDRALYLMARLADGGMRDAIGYLELCATNAGDGHTLDAETVAGLIGTSTTESAARVVSAIIRRDIGRLFAEVDALYRRSADIGIFWQSLTSFYRDMLVCRTVSDPKPYLDLPEGEMDYPIKCAKYLPTEVLMRQLRIIDDVQNTIRYGTLPQRVTVEMALTRLCSERLDTDSEALLARIAKLEERLDTGAVPAKQNAASEELDFGESTAEVPQPVTATEPQTIQSSPVSHTEKPAAPKKTELRPVKRFAEVVERLRGTDTPLAAMLAGNTLYVSDAEHRLYLVASDAMTGSLLGRGENAGKIVTAISATLHDAFTPEELTVRGGEAQKLGEEYEIIDEIAEAAASDDDANITV